jgi:hypothetical protein
MEITSSPAPNWIISAVPTPYCVAMSPSVLQIPTICWFSPRVVHSSARIMDPSHAEGKQSWKESRIAARASSVHAPSPMKLDLISVAMVVHTDGQSAAAVPIHDRTVRIRRFGLRRDIVVPSK